jgi:hypothetical protein
MLNKTTRIFAFIVLMLGFFALSMGMKAQNVVRKGNNFIAQHDSLGGNATKTEFTYTDNKGVTDTVYLSRNGSAFVWKISKKTGKRYRRYLPEVTKALGTKKVK